MIARLGALAALAAAVVLVVVLVAGGDDPYVVRAELKDAAGLRKNSDVKVGGVPGGTVKDIELTRDDHALVTMELDPETVPVGAGAAARARPVNLLGEKYVDLDVGDQSRPRRSGTQIPVSRTGTPVELDDVLNTLTPDTRGALRILINEAGVAMAGRGTDFNALLDELPPALDRTRALLTQLGAENASIRRLIAQGDRVVGSIGGRRDELARFVDTAQAALEQTSRRRAQLGATVAAAPGALGQLRTTLADLERTATELQPASRGLRRAARPLATTLAALPGFTAAAQPTLRTAREVSPALTRLGRQGVAPVRRLQPTAGRLRDFSRDLAPVLDTFDEGQAFDGALGIMNGWVKTIQTRDGLGHVFRLRLIMDEELATNILTRYGVLAPKGRRRAQRAPTLRRTKPAPAPAPRPRAERPQQQRPPLRAPKLDLDTRRLPDVRELPEQVTDGLGDLTKGALDRLGARRAPAAPAPAPGGGAQDRDLLDYLLGN